MTFLPTNLTQTLYEEDFYLWLQKTTILLREHRFEELDLENLVEEIEAMGRREKRELESRLTTMIEHLLKLIYWIAQKDYNAQGWRTTIIEQRRQIQRLLNDSPSLKKMLPDIFVDCYQAAKEDTIKKYQLPSAMFPVEPPFNIENLLDSDYLP